MDDHGTTRGERMKRMLMVCCAAVLFLLGVWLLIQPVQAHGSNFHPNDLARSLGTPGLVDNVDANRFGTMMACSVLVRG